MSSCPGLWLLLTCIIRCASGAPHELNGPAPEPLSHAQREAPLRERWASHMDEQWPWPEDLPKGASSRDAEASALISFPPGKARALQPEEVFSTVCCGDVVTTSSPTGALLTVMASHNQGLKAGSLTDLLQELLKKDGPHLLSSLTSLSLIGGSKSAAQLTGEIPTWLGNLSQLSGLFLQENSLTGRMPAALGDLSQLRELFLDGNQLHGPIPATLGNLKQLVALSLHSNRLSGPIPSTLGNLWQLVSLNLNKNRLSGSIPPSLGKLGQLHTINLSENNLVGPIPAEIGNLTNLAYFNMASNMLSSIPSTVGYLTKLVYLDLSSNRFSTIPDTFGLLTSLVTVLSLRNNQLSGAVPTFLGNLTKLWSLQLDHNRLTGPIPEELGNMTGLRQLMLSNNQLNGTLPKFLRSLTHLSALDVSMNQLSGSVDLALSPTLTELWLQNNLFTSIAGSGVGSQLSILDVSNNPLWGPWPTALLSNNSLKVLRLENCGLVGTMPRDFFVNSSLQLLFLGDNPQLSGSFPCSLLLHPSDLDCASVDPKAQPGPGNSLQELHAANCSFTSVGRLALTLVHLDFSGNKLAAAPQPEYLFYLPLRVLLIPNNNIATWPNFGVFDSSFVMNEGTSLQYYTALACRQLDPLPSSLIKIDLSNNPLGQGAREVLGSVVYLPSLIYFACNNCSLKGNIPSIYGPENVYRDSDALKDTKATQGFQSLLTLKLGNNFITGLPPEPPRSLQVADLSNNLLTSSGLKRSWFNEDGSFRLNQLLLQNNPQLEFKVTAPQPGADGGCLNVRNLTAKANAFSTRESHYECTSLCSIRDTVYTTDVADPADMCRCSPGHGGRAMNCTACPVDTFSSAADEFKMLKDCAACPAQSSTRNLTNQSSLCSCKCARGTYLSVGDACATTSAASGATCLPCGDLQTTLTVGALKIEECTCDVLAFPGLTVDAGGACRCLNGFHFDWVARRCAACSEGENCEWATYSSSQFLDPPDLRPGYWARTAGANRSGFSSHSVLRCFSSKTCTDGKGKCQTGRGGKACSLCLPGYFGGPGGQCLPCLSSQLASQLSLGLSFIMVWPLALVLHILNQLMESSNQKPRRPQTGLQVPEWLFLGLKKEEEPQEKTGSPKESCRFLGAEPEQTQKQPLRKQKTTGLRASIIRNQDLSLPSERMQGDEEEDPAVAEARERRAAWVAGCILSTFQIFQYIQLVSVMVKVETRLPPMSRRFFQGTSQGTTAVFEIGGVACLADQQSAGLELGVRWCFPVVAIFVALFTRPFALLMGVLLDRIGKCTIFAKDRSLEPAEESVEEENLFERLGRFCYCMDFVQILQVIAMACSQYFLNILVSNGMLLFTCLKSPNGYYSVQIFPHVECPNGNSADIQEWMALLGPCLVYNVIFVALLPVGVNVLVFRKVVASMAASGLKTRGPWGVFCPDFRDSHVHWLLVMVVKDLSINIATTALVSLHAPRLLIIALIAGVYAWWTSRESPYLNFINNMVEGWLAFCLAITACLLVAWGAAGLDNDMTTDILVLIIQGLALGGPTLLLTAQGAGAFTWSSRCLPRSLAPYTSRNRVEQEEEILSLLANAIQEAGGEPKKVLQLLDDVDFATLEAHLHSCAGLCLNMHEEQAGTANATVARLRSVRRQSVASRRTSAAPAVVEPTRISVLPCQQDRQEADGDQRSSATRRASAQIFGRAADFDGALPGAVSEQQWHGNGLGPMDA